MAAGKKKMQNSTTVVTGRRDSLWKELQKNYFFYLLALPGFVFLILFCYIPMAGIYLAFENYTYQGGLFGSEFVGWKNFIFLFDNMKYAMRATRNTLVMNLLGITIGIFVNVAVAVMLGEIKSEKFRKFIQTFILFPNFLSWIVIGGISDGILADEKGLLNQLITLFGGEAVPWNASPQYWWAILVIASVWKGFGYGSIVYYATLTGFDPSLYEAAEIDGAGRWKKIVKITIPLLKPTIIMLFLLDVGGILGSSLEKIMGMTRMNPLLLETTDTITTYVYRMGIGQGKFGISSAVSLYQAVVGAVLVLSANLIARKVDPEYSLF